MNRRKMLLLAGGVTLGAGLFPGRGRAEIVTATIAVAAAVAGIISAFTSRGDGGLGALLTSIRQLQIETLNQLAIVHSKLHEIETALAALDKKVEGLLDNQHMKELSAQLDGTFLAYRACVATRADQSKLTRHQRKIAAENLRELRHRIVTARQTLQSAGNIRSCPHSALIAAYVLPVEMSVRYFRDEPKAEIRSSIKDYREWREALLDPTAPDSIPSYVAKWLLEAEARYTTAMAIPLFKELMADEDKALTKCFVYQEYLPPVPAKTRSFGCGARCEAERREVVVREAEPEKFGRRSAVYSDIAITVDETSGAKILNSGWNDRDFPDHQTALETNPVGAISEAFRRSPLKGIFQLFASDYRAVCKITREAFRPPEERLEAIKVDHRFGYADQQAAYGKVKDALALINEARTFVAFGLQAQTVAENLGPIIDNFERQYA